MQKEQTCMDNRVTLLEGDRMLETLSTFDNRSRHPFSFVSGFFSACFLGRATERIKYVGLRPNTARNFLQRSAKEKVEAQK
eukprot:6248998-Amphidinium_carterae.1